MKINYQYHSDFDCTTITVSEAFDSNIDAAIAAIKKLSNAESFEIVLTGCVGKFSLSSEVLLDVAHIDIRNCMLSIDLEAPMDIFLKDTMLKHISNAKSIDINNSKLHNHAILDRSTTMFLTNVNNWLSVFLWAGGKGNAVIRTSSHSYSAESGIFRTKLSMRMTGLKRYARFQ